MCNSIDYAFPGVAQDKGSSVKFLGQREISHNSRICKQPCDDLKPRVTDENLTLVTVERNFPEEKILNWRALIFIMYSWHKEYTKITFAKEEFQIVKDSTIDFNNYLPEVSPADLLASLISIGEPNMTVE